MPGFHANQQTGSYCPPVTSSSGEQPVWVHHRAQKSPLNPVMLGCIYGHTSFSSVDGLDRIFGRSRIWTGTSKRQALYCVKGTNGPAGCLVSKRAERFTAWPQMLMTHSAVFRSFMKPKPLTSTE
ncbi:hypothetical protein GOODEAATRI_005897 [Goodea atripinnis]|uniref:Uncharacterized protein n=1 Tax=Goodea atripinnis TaxID=208336 RepID=A0ABV0PBQ9_9TELE